MKINAALALAAPALLSLVTATELELWHCNDCNGGRPQPGSCSQNIWSQFNGGHDCTWRITAIPWLMNRGDKGDVYDVSTGTCTFFLDINREDVAVGYPIGHMDCPDLNKGDIKLYKDDDTQKRRFNSCGIFGSACRGFAYGSF